MAKQRAVILAVFYGGRRMPDGERNYWLKETYRHLTLAAIGAQGKSREHIGKAMECLEKYEKIVNEDNKTKEN